MTDNVLAEVGQRLHEGQTRLAYYLTTISASAVALTLTRVESVTLDWVAILLILSVAFWAAAFWVGIFHLGRRNRAINANYAIVDLGSRNPPPPNAQEAHADIKATFDRHNLASIASARWQVRLIVLGAAAYLAWIVVGKLVAPAG